VNAGTGNPELQTVAPGVQRLDVPVTAIAGIPGTSKLAIATPRTAGDLGNSIVAFNSSTRLVEHQFFAFGVRCAPQSRERRIPEKVPCL
jgi:hypothetical protein